MTLGLGAINRPSNGAGVSHRPRDRGTPERSVASRLTLLTETERVASWTSMNNPDAARLLDPAGEDDSAQLGSPETSCTKISDRQVEMNLLRHTIRPLWRGVWLCKLEGQLERQIPGVHLTPVRITDVQRPIQETCVKARKGSRVWAVEDDRAQADHC